MALQVLTLARYMTGMGVPRSDSEWGAYKWVRAMKEMEFKGHGFVPVRGEYKQISHANTGEAARWFGMRGADLIAGTNIGKDRKLWLVPIPCSKAVVGQPTANPYAPLFLAQELETELALIGYPNASAVEVLRWSEPMASSRTSGGTRDPIALFPKLVAIKKIPDDAIVVLIDDVVTKGGHLQACAARLRHSGAGAGIWMALCAAKTTHESSEKAFEVERMDLDDYTP